MGRMRLIPSLSMSRRKYAQECGERLYRLEVTDRVLQFAKQLVKPAKMIQVPVYDFIERAVGQGIMRELS